MTVLIPEKTVEIWTGIAVTRFLPFAQIWSPPNYGGSVDQWVRAGKTWAFELKTAYSGSEPYIPIDTVQLQKHAYAPLFGVPVIYVLPAVPWSAPPTEPTPSEGASWTAYPWWAWLVSSRQLARRLKVGSKTAPSAASLNVKVAELPFPHASIATWNTGMWLAAFLAAVGACKEPRGWTTRESDDIRVRPGVRADEPRVDSNYVVVHVPKAHLPGLL